MAKAKEISKKARATTKNITVREYVNWFKKQKYNKPVYQRDFDKKSVKEFFLHLVWMVNTYEAGFEPLLDRIDIRFNNKVLEIINGQHRSQMLVAIIDGQVKIPATTSNEMQKHIIAMNSNYGKRFFELTAAEQEAILNLKIEVTTHECSDTEARAVFHALNSSKPLSTNDKTRNNYCDNNLYNAVVAHATKENSRKRGKLPFKNADGIGNFIYRCIRSDVGFDIPKKMNASILSQYAGMTPGAAKDMVANICKDAHIANSILERGLTDDQHIVMGAYMYVHRMNGRSKQTAIDTIKANHKAFNRALNNAMVESGVDFTDTAHDYSRSALAAELVADAAKVVGA